MDPQKALQVLATASEPTFDHTNQSGAAIVTALQVLAKLVERANEDTAADNS